MCAAERSVAGAPVAARMAASTGLSGWSASAVALLIAAPTSAASTADGRDEERDHGVDAGVGEDQRAGPRRSSPRWPSRACRRGSRPTPRRGSARGERRARLLGELRQLEPCRLAGVGAEDPEPAGVREHRDAPPSRDGLAGEQGGDVEQARRACRPGSRRPGGRRRRRRCPSRRGRRCVSPAAFWPARERPLFIASTGFSRASRRAMRANLRGLPNDST